MLSGEFSTIAPSDVIVKRDERVRKSVTLDSIAELADSISRKGLIHPIVLDRSHTLVAGETRLLACKTLKWEKIPFQYVDTLSENDLLGIELEENIKRKDLDWKDKCDALQRFHILQKTTEENWTVSDTAKAIGYGTSHVNEMLNVAEAVSRGDAMVSAAPKLSTAKAIVARQKQRQESDILTVANSVSGAKRGPREIIVADFNVWAKTYSGPKFNFIHMDFPYGINLHKSGQSAREVAGDYPDGEEVYWELIHTLLSCKDNLLADSGHIMFWFSMNFYQLTYEALSSIFRLDPYPLIWHKSDNTGILPDYNRLPRRVYETAFFGSFGDRQLVQPVANTFSGPTQKIAGHTSEKSEDMLKHFFRMIVDGGTNMLDPTAGSGSALRAAKSMGAGSVLGLEINATFAEDAQRVLS